MLIHSISKMVFQLVAGLCSCALVPSAQGQSRHHLQAAEDLTITSKSLCALNDCQCATFAAGEVHVVEEEILQYYRLSTAA